MTTGWEIKACVIMGKLFLRKVGSTSMMFLHAMCKQSEMDHEEQPIMIFRRRDDISFVDILKQSTWNADGERERKAEWFHLEGTNTSSVMERAI